MFLTKKNAGLTSGLDPVLRSLVESGVMTKYLRSDLPLEALIKTKSSRGVAELEAVNLSAIFSPLMFLLAGLSMASAVFALEFIGCLRQ